MTFKEYPIIIQTFISPGVVLLCGPWEDKAALQWAKEQVLAWNPVRPPKPGEIIEQVAIHGLYRLVGFLQHGEESDHGRSFTEIRSVLVDAGVNLAEQHANIRTQLLKFAIKPKAAHEYYCLKLATVPLPPQLPPPPQKQVSPTSAKNPLGYLVAGVLVVVLFISWLLLRTPPAATNSAATPSGSPKASSGSTSASSASASGRQRSAQSTSSASASGEFHKTMSGPNQYTLHITLTPAKALQQLWLDGEPRSTNASGEYKFQLPAGEHQIEAFLQPAYRSCGPGEDHGVIRKTVNLTSNKRLELKAELQQQITWQIHYPCYPKQMQGDAQQRCQVLVNGQPIQDGQQQKYPQGTQLKIKAQLPDPPLEQLAKLRMGEGPDAQEYLHPIPASIRVQQDQTISITFQLKPDFSRFIQKLKKWRQASGLWPHWDQGRQLKQQASKWNQNLWTGEDEQKLSKLEKQLDKDFKKGLPKRWQTKDDYADVRDHGPGVCKSLERWIKQKRAEDYDRNYAKELNKYQGVLQREKEKLQIQREVYQKYVGCHIHSDWRWPGPGRKCDFISKVTHVYHIPSQGMPWKWFSKIKKYINNNQPKFAIFICEQADKEVILVFTAKPKMGKEYKWRRDDCRAPYYNCSCKFTRDQKIELEGYENGSTSKTTVTITIKQHIDIPQEFPKLLSKIVQHKR